MFLFIFMFFYFFYSYCKLMTEVVNRNTLTAHSQNLVFCISEISRTMVLKISISTTTLESRTIKSKTEHNSIHAVLSLLARLEE